MYNYSFLSNIINHNALFLFHNEDDVEKNLIGDITKRLYPFVESKYPERTREESLLALQFPSANSPEAAFNNFFDSPCCASIMFSSFRGVFVIDCSRYKSYDKDSFDKLFDYIKDNSSECFTFIVLMSQLYKKSAVEHINTSNLRNVHIADLETNESYLTQLRSIVTTETFDLLVEQYKSNSRLRQKSPNQIKEVIVKAVESNKDIKNELIAFTSNNDSERRIGF